MTNDPSVSRRIVPRLLLVVPHGTLLPSLHFAFDDDSGEWSPATSPPRHVAPLFDTAALNTARQIDAAFSALGFDVRVVVGDCLRALCTLAEDGHCSASAHFDDRLATELADPAVFYMIDVHSYRADAHWGHANTLGTRDAAIVYNGARTQNDARAFAVAIRERGGAALAVRIALAAAHSLTAAHAAVIPALLLAVSETSMRRSTIVAALVARITYAYTTRCRSATSCRSAAPRTPQTIWRSTPPQTPKEAGAEPPSGVVGAEPPEEPAPSFERLSIDEMVT